MATTISASSKASGVNHTGFDIIACYEGFRQIAVDKVVSKFIDGGECSHIIAAALSAASWRMHERDDS